MTDYLNEHWNAQWDILFELLPIKESKHIKNQLQEITKDDFVYTGSGDVWEVKKQLLLLQPQLLDFSPIFSEVHITTIVTTGLQHPFVESIYPVTTVHIMYECIGVLWSNYIQKMKYRYNPAFGKWEVV